MADVPDINSLKPIWPTRPDEKTVRRRRQTEDGNSEERKRKKEKDKNKGNAGDGHLDEYV